MSPEQIEMAIIIGQLGLLQHQLRTMVPLWKTLAKGLARVVAFFKIPEEPAKETAHAR